MKEFTEQFGGKADKSLKERYAQSENWQEGRFENLVETKMEVNIQNIPKFLYKQICQGEGRNPKEPISIVPFDKERFLADAEEVQMIWYGHSVLLMRLNGKTLLIDPMLGLDSSPIAPFATKRFSEGTLELIDELPEIDLLLMTHDHYDHLDYASIKRLKSKTKRYFVALGVARHLESWGVEADKITEFDWWDEQAFDDIAITFTPTRHFSGRGLTDRAKSLWGGWVFKTATKNIYFSGDGGYGEHFKEVGKRLGPFDFGLMECGQYNENWHEIHLYPEESIQAAIDAGANRVMAVHWAGFALAQHHWKEPAERFQKEAIAKGLSPISPRIGQQFGLNAQGFDCWWEEV